MSIPGVSSILENIVYEKMRNALSSTYTEEMVFNQSNNGIEIKPEKIIAMTITQDFLGSVIDTIGLKCTFFPRDYITLLENAQDLKMTMTQRRWFREIYAVDMNRDPDVYEFKVMIQNPNDLLRQIPPAIIKQTKEVEHDRDQIKIPIELNMQLVPTWDYDAMKQKGTTTLSDTDVSSVILYMCNIWGIKNTDISPVENTKKYPVIEVPAMTELPALVNEMQTKYGIYKKGASCYYCGNTFYVYPPFDTEPEKNEIVNIFRLPENSVDGGDEYYTQEGEDLYIVSFSKVQAQNTAPASTENQGNAVTIKQADASTDVAREINNDGKVTLNPQATIIAKVNSGNTTTGNQVNTKHGGTTANMFEELSKIAAGQMELIGLGWIHAKPWVIKPAMKCILHYDDTTIGSGKDEDYYNTVPGIVTYAEYNLRVQGKPSERIYRWDAQLALATPPKEPKDGQVQQPTPQT